METNKQNDHRLFLIEDSQQTDNTHANVMAILTNGSKVAYSGFIPMANITYSDGNLKSIMQPEKQVNMNANFQKEMRQMYDKIMSASEGISPKRVYEALKKVKNSPELHNMVVEKQSNLSEFSDQFNKEFCKQLKYVEDLVRDETLDRLNLHEEKARLKSITVNNGDTYEVPSYGEKIDVKIKSFIKKLEALTDEKSMKALSIQLENHSLMFIHKRTGMGVSWTDTRPSMRDENILTAEMSVDNGKKINAQFKFLHRYITIDKSPELVSA